MSHRKENVTVKGKVSGCRKSVTLQSRRGHLGDPGASRCDVITGLNPEKGLDLSVTHTL